MSIRSVDFQMLVPKTQQQSKTMQQSQDKLRIEHQQFIQEDKKNIEHQMNRVNAFDKKNPLNVHDQNGGKQQSHEQKRNKYKRKKETENENDKNMQTVGSRIDIKI